MPVTLSTGAGLRWTSSSFPVEEVYSHLCLHFYCGYSNHQCQKSPEVDFSKLILSSWHVGDIKNTIKVRGQFGFFE